ncbi:uncharacterized protein LOC126680577 [Mercurialis annua]|uniref:uncharacterized protein LOC126680577 n=1 Tax=Mercurialis annua TaxID=3986 RepID=UPI0021604DE2|nr:uncharacterized protein LOC126680577 [Mercurialis annua]
MKDFSNFINSSSLFEVPLQGRFFTWYNKLSRSKIDRCFVSYSSLNIWPKLSLKALARLFLDHAVISESIAKRNLVAKLKELRSLGAVQKSITDLDYTADARPLDDSELTLLSSLHVEFDKVSRQLDSLWLQKSRLNWNQFGERNTKYYHSIATIRSRSNLISEIWVNNVLYSDSDDIKKHVHSFYKNVSSKRSTTHLFAN